MITLRDEQAQWVRDVLMAMAEHGSCLGVSPTGSGKCLGKGTGVMMADGTIKKVEDVQVGELLLGPDSKPRRVVSLARGREMMYRVSQHNAASYVCNESHILSLKVRGRGYTVTIADRLYKSGEVVNISVRDYLQLSDMAKSKLAGWFTGVSFNRPNEQLPIDPYFLGVWLGDGCCGRPLIVNNDPEIIEAIRDYAKQLDMRFVSKRYKKPDGRDQAWRTGICTNKVGTVNRITKWLDKLGILHSKRIPEMYKLASKADRLQLLAGIIDTDGYLQKGKQYEIIFKSTDFADDFCWLCRSLGFAVRRSDKLARADKDSEFALYQRVYVRGNLSMIPCKVARRKPAADLALKYSSQFMRIDVQAIGEDEYFGFEITGTDRLFLLHDFTVTHNTVMFNEIVRRCVKKNYRVLILAHREELLTQAQAKLYQSHKIIGGIIMAGYKGDYSLPVQIASVQTLVNRRMPKNIQVIIIDEAHHTTAQTYRKILENYPEAKILGVTATPVRSSGEGFEDVFKSMVIGPSIKWLEQQGSLVPAKQCVCPLSHAELAKIKVTAGDYNEKQLSAFMCSTTQRQIDMWVKYAAGLKTIAFAVDIAHMDKLMTEAKRRGIKCQAVTGTTDKDLRKSYFGQVQRGDIQILFNVGVATEGTDIPQIECVFCCRPTKSLSLYMQMVGRGSRPSSGKDHYLLLDCANLVLTHGEPNKDRRWTLTGAGKKRGQQDIVRVFDVTFPDGSTKIMSATSMPTRLEALHLEERENLRVDTIEQCITLAKARGHKPVSAMYKFFKEAGRPSTSEINYIATRLNLSESWVTQQAQKQK
jgi:superfamily II DNA or RNA helicase